MSGKVTAAQSRFLESYVELLGELEDVYAYVSECYIKGDVDIGDRLLRDVMKGMLPYHPENMTVVSIFGDDAEAMQVLGKFHGAVLQAVEVEQRFADGEGTGERMRFLHEVLVRRYQSWRVIVEKKKSEWESSGE
ncbi:hypothetical protein JSY36_14080 [Bacillus sp. H-16]|uniref:hypothetical protein n=1 Tax=Alteribacter salitolerans TaxID=2912333 RepID=UPI001962D71B|nr:hypothetical protein [Alteribacter salitolerans]MBM7096860.1 hypothetical protein [Alteribacter salitolerans]